MKNFKVMTVLGTRPEIIRLSEIIKCLDKNIEHILVHTGQNYDFELNQIFFDELGIRKPDYFLEANKNNTFETIGTIITNIDSVLEQEKPDAFFVLGDTNSCLSAYVAKRKHIPVFHMEAGNRSFDQRVPEETNRKIIDHLSDINMTYSELSRMNLLREGLRVDTVFKVGSPLYEVFQKNKEGINKSTVLSRLGLSTHEYFVMSAHREENVDSADRLRLLMETLEKVYSEFKKPVIMTTHPRTRKQIEKLNIEIKGDIRFEKPFGYFDYMSLQKSSLCTISDSGSVNEESAMVGFKAVNLRESHERPEANDCAVTIMSGITPDGVIRAIHATIDNELSAELPDGYGVLDVSRRVLNHILGYTEYVNRTVWS